MDVTHVQSSASYQTLYPPPTASPKTSQSNDVIGVGNADVAGVTAKNNDSLAVGTNPSSTATAEIDKYISDLSGGQSLTVLYTLAQTTLKVTDLGNAGYDGLISDPNNPNVRYRPGVVNIDPVQPPGAPTYHTSNWGGYGAVQATPPPPTQIVDDHPTTFAAVDAGEILILPTQDAPNQPAAQQSSETVYTPAAPAVPISGPVQVASRSNLVPSTDPLAAGNVEFGRGLQPTSSDVVQNWIPSPTSATPPATSIVGGAPIELTGGTVTIDHVPIVNSNEASIMTVNPDGTTTVDENSATTTAADLSKYTKGLITGKTVSANGTITVYSSAAAASKSAAGNALDVTA